MVCHGPAGFPENCYHWKNGIMAIEQSFLHQLATDTTPVGHLLAEQVASKLESGQWLGYSHRDYCGMGLEYRERRFVYGELQDGMIYIVKRQFDSRSAFVEWLAVQSTASLARLDEADDFVRGNQVITRQRLQAFVTGF